VQFLTTLPSYMTGDISRDPPLFKLATSYIKRMRLITNDF
jgi:hypothetical protein